MKVVDKQECFSNWIIDIPKTKGIVKYADLEYSFFYAENVDYKKEEELLNKYILDCNKRTREFKRNKETNYKTIASPSKYNINIDLVGEERLIIDKGQALSFLKKEDVEFILNNYKSILTPKQIKYLNGENKSKNRHHRYAKRIKNRFEKYITIDNEEEDMLCDIRKEFEEASNNNDAFINFILKYYNDNFMYEIIYSSDVPSEVKEAFNKIYNGKSRHKSIKVKYLNIIYDKLLNYFK